MSLLICKGAGLVGLGFAPYAKTMTITAADDLSCRLLRLNASFLWRRRKSSKSRQVPTAICKGVNDLPAPLAAVTDKCIVAGKHLSMMIPC